MRQLLDALREWLQLRSRLREERRFHLDRAVAELRTAGMSSIAAHRRARSRFGGRKNLTAARCELGCDLAGLAYLFRAHRAFASPCLQPAILLCLVALIFVISPTPREILDGVIVRIANIEDPGAVVLSVAGRSPWHGGAITPAEFTALRSMSTITEVGAYRGSYARARAIRAVTPSAVEVEALSRTGERFIVTDISHRKDLVMNPAQAVWLFILIYGLYFLFGYVRQFGSSARRLWRWLLYGVPLAGLHAAASLAVWALALEMWNGTHQTFVTGGLTYAALFGAYLGLSALQCRLWWTDLRQRCPVCLDRLVLPLTEGTAESVLFNPAITESVCVYGHGVLVENRWARAFRPEESPLQQLLHR